MTTTNTHPALTITAVDLFAGPGGWDVYAPELGIDITGIEYDHWACETRRAAGLPTIEADVRTLNPLDFPTHGHIASPPCQTFSMAGKGAGRAALTEVLQGVTAMANGDPHPHFDDEKTALVLEPLRWILARYHSGNPYAWVALEQVPSVLPVWEAYAHVLRGLGYGVATGALQAEQYGVPQTRRRAILVARYKMSASLPTPTHAKYRKGTPQDQPELGLLPWVSMADALGEGMTQRPSMTVTGGGTSTEAIGNGGRQGMRREQDQGHWKMRSNYGTGGDPRNRGERGEDEPSATITSKADRNKWVQETLEFAGAGATAHITSGQRPRRLEEPAHTITGGGTAAWVPRANNQSGSEYDLEDQIHTPATTLAGREIVGFRGANGNRFNGSKKSRNDGFRVTQSEAAALQTFPPDYPWQGGKGQQFQQIGNAIPPQLAAAILGTLTT